MLNLKRRTVVDVDALLATQTTTITVTLKYLHNRVTLLGGRRATLPTLTSVAIPKRQLAARIGAVRPAS
jgi:hypothetical protein